MLEHAVQRSVNRRWATLAAFLALLCAGGWAAVTLPLDAMPDVSSVQVAVLTNAPGLAPLEVERTITTPIENALNGVPGMAELRSTSRSGLSAVAVVFSDGTDVWHARQLVAERLRGIEVELPPQAESPQLGPVTTGLGEIFTFVLRSERHSPMQLRTLLDWEIVPQLRAVPGVSEVNTFGGQLKQFQVLVDAERLKARKLTLADVTEALRGANLNIGGGYVDRAEESYTLRGDGLLHDDNEIASVVLRTDEDGTSVLVRNVAEVRIGAALPNGVVTYNGDREAVTGTVMMLVGSNSHQVVAAVAKKVKEIGKQLPAGVGIDVVYDRADFVDRTLRTVLTNLAEGIGIVTLVLVLFLGTLRGALAVVLGIPASMAVALLFMRFTGVTGDLMSLGAIDFGFLVDGPIIMLEAVIAATAGQALTGAQKSRRFAEVLTSVARPVTFAVAIILLVYLPLLGLEGIEGKMFRPMAATMAAALAGAVLYAIVFLPAVLVTLVPTPKNHGRRWILLLNAAYARTVTPTLRWRGWLLAAAFTGLLLVAWRFAAAGAEFVPRIFEGDAVVTIRRAPSISLAEAKRLDLMTEKVLRTFPEVVSVLGMTGRAEVAVDPVGNDNTDMLVRLRPVPEWTTAHDFDALSTAFLERIHSQVPATFAGVSQPIEDLTNELISGSRADVAIQIFGNNIQQLSLTAAQIARRVGKVAGTGDVRIERVFGQPTLQATVDRPRMARYGVQVRDAFSVLEASRAGIHVGEIYEDVRRFELRVMQPPRENTIPGLGELAVATKHGVSVPLREVVNLTETDDLTAVRRIGRERVVRVNINLRGRDLVSWVDDARASVAQDVTLPAGFRLEWGGQFENFERAQKRLRLVVPAVILVIVFMLLWMFRHWRYAAAVFTLVPLSLTGGMAGLLLREMTFSLPAVVGLIALGGIGVLNGVVMASEVRRRLHAGETLDHAVTEGAVHSMRAVLTTAAVAALGFLPMALAQSAGAEVQRPLATAVIVGMAWSTALTLWVLPGVLRMLVRPEKSEPSL
jgi:cobalt-zinc-cadmium resistance protein CzcA